MRYVVYSIIEMTHDVDCDMLKYICREVEMLTCHTSESESSDSVRFAAQSLHVTEMQR